MISELIVTIIILLTNYIYFKYVRATKLQMLRYKKLFQSQGYKVKFMPFTFLRMTFAEKMQQGVKQHNDYQLFQKKQLSQYDVCISSGLNRPVLNIIHPDLIKDFFSHKSQDWKKIQFPLKPLIRILGKGLPYNEGSDWKKKRTIISRVFHFQFIQSLTSRINQSVDRILAQFQQKNQNKEMNMWILDEFRKITASVMIKGFFGSNQNLEVQGQPIQIFSVTLLRDTLAQMFDPLTMILGTKFLDMGIRKKDRQFNKRIKMYKIIVEAFINKKIDKFKKQGKRENIDIKDKNMLQQLYFSGHLNTQNQQNITVDELISQFNNFLAAGTDTSSSLASNIIIQLSENEEVKQKLLKQINQCIKNPKVDINIENMKNMKYLNAVVQEILRKQPSINSLVFRYNQKNLKLGNVPISKQTMVFIQILANGYNQKYFTDVNKFKPQRWLNDTLIKQNPFILIPFSGGQRNCIGQHLALLQTKIIVIKFLLRYNFKVIGPIKRLVVSERFQTLISIRS